MALPFDPQALYMNRDDIINVMIEEMQSRIPDVYVGDDGNLYMLFQVMASAMENLYIAQSFLGSDIFLQTANQDALEKYGDQYNIPLKPGTPSVGNLKFFGAGGTFIPMTSSAAYDIGTGLDPIYFTTTVDATIPSPGIPTAPTATDRVLGGNLTGLMEYVVTFLTAGGETAPSAHSNALNVNTSQIRLTALPLGGTGTTGRRIYRMKNGGPLQLVTTINDNTTVLFDDNVTDGALGGAPPAVSTAESILVAAAGESYGIIYNVGPGVINEISDVPSGVNSVTNPAGFTGGSEPEDWDDFRARLLGALRAPSTGSPNDLISWAMIHNEVDTAVAFPNNNMGVAANGHVTIRVSGPDGAIVDPAIITEIQDDLQALDVANMIVHVTGFTGISTAVSVTITLDTSVADMVYTVADLTPSIQQAISDYVNALPVGASIRPNGIIDAVFGLPGVADLTVTAPSGVLSTAPDSKRLPGTITVS